MLAFTTTKRFLRTALLLSPLLASVFVGSIYLASRHKLPPVKTTPSKAINAPKPAPVTAPRKVFGTPNYERGDSKLPYYAQWGPYTIVVEQVGKDETGEPQRVRILDNAGKTLREIEDIAILGVEEVELTGRTPAELHIQTHTLGAYASVGDTYFTLEGGLRNILTFDGNDLGVRGIKDLNGDGIPEIILENPVFEDFKGYNFHRHLPLITILGWNGVKYVDQTRLYPQRSWEEAQTRKQDIREAIEDKDFREWALEDLVTAYYANMLSIGRGNEARAWLLRHLPKESREHLLDYEKELRTVVAGAVRKADAHNETVFQIH